MAYYHLLIDFDNAISLQVCWVIDYTYLWKDSEMIEQIDRDVKRTHPDMNFFCGDSSLAMSNQVNLNLYLMLGNFRFNKEKPEIIFYTTSSGSIECTILEHEIICMSSCHFFQKKSIHPLLPCLCGETEGQSRVIQLLQTTVLSCIHKLLVPMLLKRACYFLLCEVSKG